MPRAGRVRHASTRALVPREARCGVGIHFLFIERDPANLAALETELKQFSPLPARVNVDTGEGDAFERLSTILADLRRDRARMAPSFLFVDPYGFKIPAALLADLMKAAGRRIPGSPF